MVKISVMRTFLKLININVFLRETQSSITKCPSLLSNSDCQTKATTNYRNTQSSGQPKSKAGKGRLVHSFGGGGAGLTGLQKETEAWQPPMAVPPRSGVTASKLR